MAAAAAARSSSSSARCAFCARSASSSRARARLLLRGGERALRGGELGRARVERRALRADLGVGLGRERRRVDDRLRGGRVGARELALVPAALLLELLLEERVVVVAEPAELRLEELALRERARERARGRAALAKARVVEPVVVVERRAARALERERGERVAVVVALALARAARGGRAEAAPRPAPSGGAAAPSRAGRVARRAPARRRERRDAGSDATRCAYPSPT